MSSLIRFSTLKQRDAFLNRVKLDRQCPAVTNRPKTTKQKKDCPPDKIRNPKSKRCVLKTGKIGIQVLKNRARARARYPGAKV